MKKIFFAWECGAGLGHMTIYVELIKQLLADGDQVAFAVQSLKSAHQVFQDIAVTLFQSPIKSSSQKQLIQAPMSYTHVLYNQGFNDSDDLLARVKAWKSLYQLWQADIIICDHAPTAVLASHLYKKAKLIISGSSFCLPPQRIPIPCFNTKSLSEAELLDAEVSIINEKINPIMRILAGAEFHFLADVFNSYYRWFQGCNEIDAYYHAKNCRSGEKFLGINHKSQNDDLNENYFKKGIKTIFIYMYQPQRIAPVLNYLKQTNYQLIIYNSQLPPEFIKKHKNSRTVFYSQLLDFKLLAEHCDLVITNGSYNASVEFLSYGQPVMMLPLHIEQKLNANSIESMGCGIHIKHPPSYQQIKTAIELLLQDDSSYKKQAKLFAENYKKKYKQSAFEIMYQQLKQCKSLIK